MNHSKMSQMGGEEAINDRNNDSIRSSIEGSGWTTLETTNIGSTIGDGNAQGNEGNSTNALLLENLPDRRRLPLPLELNCQIFECLKFGIQRKFIGGLGRGIYGIFRQKVLSKSKRLLNPEENGWEVSNKAVILSSNGLMANDNTGFWQNVSAKKGFPITDKLSRMGNFPGTILYYFEVTQMSPSSSDLRINVGFSSGNIADYSIVGFEPNSYAFYSCYDCWLSGNSHDFEWPNGVTKPPWNGSGDVFGCGLLISPENKLSIFFTGNGILMGKQIPIFPTVDTLYPTVTMHRNVSIVTNFGDDLAKLFSYDINKCPGMVFK